MVVARIREMINECRKDVCSDDDINEISAMIMENRNVLGDMYGKLVNELAELRNDKKPVESPPQDRYVDAGGVTLRAYDNRTEKIRAWAKEKARVDLMIAHEKEKAKQERVDWNEWIKQFKNPNAEDWFVILQPTKQRVERHVEKPRLNRQKPANVRWSVRILRFIVG